MQAPVFKGLAVVIAAAIAFASAGDAWAAKKKARVKRDSSSSSFVAKDYDGTPVIMQGLGPAPSIMIDEPGTKKRAAKPTKRPRGSSTYIPPPVPSPDTPRAVVPPNPQPYRPPPINSYGDRATGCIHSFPLQGGIGNNPAGQSSYVRQCAN